MPTKKRNGRAPAVLVYQRSPTSGGAWLSFPRHSADIMDVLGFGNEGTTVIKSPVVRVLGTSYLLWAICPGGSYFVLGLLLEIAARPASTYLLAKFSAASRPGTYLLMLELPTL